MRHDSRWHTAAPLWPLSLADTGAAPLRFRQPAILRFVGEGFMDALGDLLDRAPESLSDHVVQPERWDGQRAGWVVEADLPNEPIKLYQPVHDRYYLVAASLVCRVPGLPDRAIDRSAEERAGFVLRRVTPAVPGGAIDPRQTASRIEHAWIGDRQSGQWRRVASPTALEAGEERHKLFSLAYQQDAQKRRLHAGLIPVAGRETYEQATLAGRAPVAGGLGDDPLADPRLTDLRDRVLVAAEALVDEAAGGLTDGAAREAFLFLLLDMAELLARDLPTVWAALVSGRAGLTAADQELRDLLETPPGVSAPGEAARWSALLRDAEAHRAEILAGTLQTPPRLAGLAPRRDDIAQAISALLEASIEERWSRALATQPPRNQAADAPGAGAAEDASDPEENVYIVRAWYDRPRCGGLRPPEMSAASTPFRLASFFDADAPVRALRVRLPIDTSVKGLRRFPKSVSFLISQELRKQIEKVEGLGLGQVEDGELNAPSGSVGFGVIWVLSIPIISICALILLMITVQLLNIVFWWLPFFKIAIPIRLGGSE